MLSLLFLTGCSNIEFPGTVLSEAIDERLIELSGECTLDTCVPVISLDSTTPVFEEYLDLPESGFQPNYHCDLSSPERSPILASTEALAQIAEECNAVDGRSHLIFPHWWETTCFFVLEDGPDYGSVRFPDYVEDPADYLYVACKPETLEAGYY